MSVAERRGDADALPAFDRGWLYDDPEDPDEVTVFSTAEGDDLTTHWITADADYAVPLDERR